MKKKENIWVANGCDACNGSGYDGRVGIYELLTIDEEIKEAIHKRIPENQLRNLSKQKGMIAMKDDGSRWIEKGITSPSEIVRVTKD